MVNYKIHYSDTYYFVLQYNNASWYEIHFDMYSKTRF